MQRRTLPHTGLDVPTMAFGAAALGGIYDPADDAESVRTVHAAVEAGVDLIDTSPYYGAGRSESVLGRALRDLRRDSYLLSTKCGRYGLGDFDFSPGRVAASIDESLGRLGLDHVDIFLLHDIEFVPLGPVIGESLPALERVKRDGKARFVGFSGLPLAVFERVVPAGAGVIDVVLSYCHHTLFDTTLLGLLPLLERHQIDLVNASPTSMGLLTEQGPPAWHPAQEAVRAACGRAATRCRDRGADIATVAVGFSCANPAVPTTLVSAEDRARLRSNIDAVSRPPDPELLAAVCGDLDAIRDQSWPSGLPENNVRHERHS
jgi:aryl-alcohol dehydrogenase-like predicted oxidoreductase